MKFTHYRQPRPDFVYDNIDSIGTICRTLSISFRSVSNYTLIPEKYLYDYRDGLVYPSKRNYNKLAAFFDWEVWL